MYISLSDLFGKIVLRMCYYNSSGLLGGLKSAFIGYNLSKRFNSSLKTKLHYK